MGQMEQKNGKYKTNGNHKSQVVDFDYIGSPIEVVFEKFNTSLKGLSEEKAKQRLEEYGYNEPAKKKKRTIFVQILSKFFKPPGYRTFNHCNIFIILR